MSLFNTISGKIRLTKNHNLGLFTHINKYRVINLTQPEGNYSDFHACKLKTDDGYIMENVWQSCKVYKDLPAHKYKKFNLLMWKQKSEKHIDDNNKLTDAYFAWKQRLMENKVPVVYPCGYSNRNKYEFVFHENNVYNLHDGFYNIYIPMYLHLIQKNIRFSELHYNISNGQNVLIICDNLPYEEIEFNLVNKEHIFYSSGYCLALALLRKFNIF